MSSSTSNLPESISDPNDINEHTSKEEPSDQSKNGGVESNKIGGRDANSAAESGGEGEQGEEEEEEGECGFCLFMKGGGCRETFTDWEKCVEEAEKTDEDVVEKCFQVTANLKKCMEAHSDYYEPILRAEKAAEEEVTKELQSEGEKVSEERIDASDSSAPPEISEEQVKL